MHIKTEQDITLPSDILRTSLPIYQAIMLHPFNQELLDGSLMLDKFSYYLEQDSFYLQHFSRAHALVSVRIDECYRKDFLDIAQVSVSNEHDAVHRYFQVRHALTLTGQYTPSCLNYIHFLLSTCSLASIEESVAALVPCFWIYHDLGQWMMSTQPGISHPYIRWIENYSCVEFDRITQSICAILCPLYDSASAELQTRMIRAFHTSSCMEWHFWNDAYHKIVFDPIRIADMTD